VSFETKEGHPAMHIWQRWDEVDVKPGGAQSLEQESWFEPQTFRPLSHVRLRTAADKVAVKGNRFQPDKCIGWAGLPDNLAGDFSLSTAEPAYNFEYDMELLQVLPLAEGYAANIVFYDAGIDQKADHYVLKVAARARLQGWDGKPVDCWVVTADYNS